jgi:hypothetical protein
VWVGVEGKANLPGFTLTDHPFPPGSPLIDQQVSETDTIHRIRVASGRCASWG